MALIIAGNSHFEKLTPPLPSLEGGNFQDKVPLQRGISPFTTEVQRSHKHSKIFSVSSVSPW
jgi:hypothetical protein